VIRHKIHGKMGDSQLLVGERLENLHRYMPADRTILITDAIVRKLHGDRFPPCPVIEIGQGEAVKTPETVSMIYKQLMELDADRSAFITGIGGGIVCDISGFTASTYLRGVRFGFVPSTLLAQVDASVGGKNGVNFRGYKNMIGVFNQPEFVICDTNLLKTLTETDYLCGFAEIVKHAVIADAEMFAFLEKNCPESRERNQDVLQKLVHDSIVIKSEVVNRDEREKGERRKLNFGHTFGHAIEKTAGIPHGQAVSAGMVIAARLSVSRGLLSENEALRIEALLEKLGLPTRIPVNIKEASDALKRDKKREGKGICFVLIKGIGNAVTEDITVEELEAVFKSWEKNAEMKF